VSRAHIYGSLRELAADVPLVAVVTVGSGATKVPADERGTDGGSAVLVDVAITRLLKGEAPATIPVRLLTSAEPESDLPSALVPGASYVLFLQPFEWHPGLRSGQWTVPGGAGIYRVSASGLRLESPGPDELPADLSSIPRLAAEID
jgi:hypothetical protein